MMKLACLKYMPPNGSENAGHPDSSLFSAVAKIFSLISYFAI